MPNPNDHLIETLRGLFVRETSRTLETGRSLAWQVPAMRQLEVRLSELERASRLNEELIQQLGESFQRSFDNAIQETLRVTELDVFDEAGQNARTSVGATIPSTPTVTVTPITPFWNRILANAEEDE